MDHLPTGARRGTQALSCCCLHRDLRLIEVTETICKRLLDYSLHKERTGSNRFAKVGLVLTRSFPPGPGSKGVCWSWHHWKIVPWELLSSASPCSSSIAVCTPPLLSGLISQ